MIIIVIGVSGSGKSTVGKSLAERLHIPFHDADDYHPKKNIEKMKGGEPLTDVDRLPWLQALTGLMRIWENDQGAVLACSALKESYRLFMQKEVPGIKWVYLQGSKALISERLASRSGHFFNPQLLDSQFEALEEPEYGVHMSISKPIEEITDELEAIFK